MLEGCRTLLYGVSLHVDVSDHWLWLPDPLEGCSVRGMYHVVTTKDLPLADSAAEMIWHRQVPLKVSIFAWRLLRDKSTKLNLVNRGVISSEVSVFFRLRYTTELAQHLLLS